MPPRTPNAPSQEGVFEDDDKLPKVESDGAETSEQLKARIAALEAELAKSTAGRLIAEEESARLSAQAQSSLFTANVTERFSRRTDDGKDLWWYRIDLAPCGGIDIRLNGQQYVHGTTYEFSTDVLRSVKEIVARTWDHENNISGANENAYKVAQDRVLRGGDRRR